MIGKHKNLPISTAIPKIEDKTSVTKIEDKVTDKELLHKQIQAILAEYEGQESNIPITHPYWHLVHEYTSLNK